MREHVEKIDHFKIKHQNAHLFRDIDYAIQDLFEPNFITYPQTAECIEAIIRMAECKNVLELGTYSGFTTLHMIRAVIPDGMVTTVECRPVEMHPIFKDPRIAKHVRFVIGHTPECFGQFKGQKFDLVFIDSDHSPEHCERERLALNEITEVGSVWLYHDLPFRQTKTGGQCQIHKYMESLVDRKILRGWAFPSETRLDCENAWGKGYPRDMNPQLGIFVRNK